MSQFENAQRSGVTIRKVLIRIVNGMYRDENAQGSGVINGAIFQGALFIGWEYLDRRASNLKNDQTINKY
jgi:hypothetical protein